MVTFLILLFLAGTGLCANGDEPLWFNIATGRSADCYFQGHGIGRSPDEAADNAWRTILRNIGMAHADKIQSQIHDIRMVRKNIKTDSIVAATVSTGMVFKNGNRLFSVVATHQSIRSGTDGMYHHYLLVCEKEANCEGKIELPSYNGALIRSLILPGLGHFYKGRTGRGVFHAGSFILVSAAAVISFTLSNQYYQKACNTRTPCASEVYTYRRDITYYAGIGAGAFAVGLYVWSIFDAKNCDGIPELR